jgi:hypothetical protein
MVTLNIIFLFISIYMFCGWLFSEKNEIFNGQENKKNAYLMYYLWPLFLLKNDKN